mmetsp:Transcript_6310/g.7383  ORF Transcript_6310/g.7383 Transcript_6310/m.7383 type:complete len:100 (-) Transcript_6310:644-943(-)
MCSVFVAFLLTLFFIDQAADRAYILNEAGLLISPRWQLQLLGRDKLEDLVGDDKGVEQIHRDLRLLVQHISQGEAHNVGGKNHLDLIPQLLIGDELFAV